MKRKRFAAFLMAAMLLLCAGSAQAVGNKLLGNIKYGVPVPYENRVYGYALDVYLRFDMFGDAVIAEHLYTPEEQFKQLHDGILRDTPAGQMLEMAMSFVAIADDGRTVPTTAVYYDFYANGYEYIFMMTALNDNAYDAAQKLLDSMMQTVSIWQVGL